MLLNVWYICIISLSIVYIKKPFLRCLFLLNYFQKLIWIVNASFQMHRPWTLFPRTNRSFDAFWYMPKILVGHFLANLWVELFFKHKYRVLNWLLEDLKMTTPSDWQVGITGIWKAVQCRGIEVKRRLCVLVKCTALLASAVPTASLSCTVVFK